MLADEVDYVIGVDTHSDQHTLAVVVASTGAVVGQSSVRADRPGYLAALAAAGRYAGGVRVWVVEGSGHYGAGLTRFLSDRGEAVVEAGRSPRTERRLRGKNDPFDAVRAARSVLAAETMATPRVGERQEALRVLLLARRAVDVRRLALVQLRSVIVTAPEGVREELRHLPVGQLLRRCSRFRRSSSRTPDELAIVLVLRALARRIEAATAEASLLQREILGHVRALVPELLNEPGVGPIVAAQLIVAWSHRCPHRADSRPATASAAAATANSTGPSTPSSFIAANTTPRRGTTSHDASLRAKAHATQPGSSSATSHATSTASCRTRAQRWLDSK